MSSDVWSIGCCIILIATGNSPWSFDKTCDPYIDALRVSYTPCSYVHKCTGIRFFVCVELTRALKYP